MIASGQEQHFVYMQLNKRKLFLKSHIFKPRVFPTNLVIYPQDKFSSSGFQDCTIQRYQ
jgi:hypothetical protein